MFHSNGPKTEICGALLHRTLSHPPASDGVDDTPVPEERLDHTPQIREYPMKLDGPAYPVLEDAVEGVDHVQRYGQCHIPTPLSPLNKGADMGDSVGRRPLPPEAELAVVQPGNTSGQMRLDAGSHQSLQ